MIFWLYGILQSGKWLNFRRNKLPSAFCLEGWGRMLLRKGDRAVRIFDAVKSPPLTQALLLERGGGDVCYTCTASTQVVGLQGVSVSSVLLRKFRYWWYADVRFSQQCCVAEGVGLLVMLRCLVSSQTTRIFHIWCQQYFFFSCGF